MKKCSVIVCLIIAFMIVFSNVSNAMDFEILKEDVPVICCDGEQVVGERVDYIPYSPVFDEFINSQISLFSNKTNRLENIYEFIYGILKEHSDEMIGSENSIAIPLKNLGYQLTQEEFDIIVNRIMYENGDLFISKNYTYTDSFDGRYVTSVCFYYFVQPSKIDTVLNQINEKVKPFVDKVNTDALSEYEKVLLTHDYICSITRYVNSSDSGTTNQFHSMYGLFTRGVCVCQGYSEAMIFLLRKLGIDSGAVLCDKINHVWNCVKVDGKWYHIDLTWDDVYNNIVDDYGNVILNIDSVRYKSFMKGFDDVVRDKENNGYIVVKENGKDVKKDYVFSSGDFEYPSFDITDNDTENYEYRDGYITDGFECVPFGLRNADGSVVYEKIEPKGFFYSDGMLVMRINSNQVVLPQTCYFEFNSMKKTDLSVSRPFKNNYEEYCFLSYHFDSNSLQNRINMWMKNISGVDWKVGKTIANNRYIVGNYKLSYINNSNVVCDIDNSSLTEFFVWDGMRPMAHKIRK